MKLVAIALNGDIIARKIVFGNAFKRVPETMIPDGVLSIVKNDSTNHWGESVLYAINTEANLVMRLSPPLYEHTSHEIIQTTYRLATVLRGEYKTMSFQYASVNGSEDVITIETLHKSLFETYEEAKAAMENYIQNDKPLYVSIPYGSFFYNESRDRDFLCLRFHGEKNLPKIDRIKESIGNTNRENGSDDVVYMHQSPMSRLALECVMIEYPEIKDILSEFVTMSLCDAIEANTAYRLEIAEFFPADFTLRKAVFAKLQRDIYETTGVFCDTKSKISKIIDAIDNNDNYPIDSINRLFYHNALPSDLSKVYKWLFNKLIPDSTRDGYAVMANDRDLYIIRGGKIYVSEYSSSYEYDKVYRDVNINDIKSPKIVEM